MQLPADSMRAAELAAYLTHQKLQPVHQKLTLSSAMTLCYKMKLKATCATFAHRLLELEPAEKLAAKARQVRVPRPPPPSSGHPGIHSLCVHAHHCAVLGPSSPEETPQHPFPT